MAFENCGVDAQDVDFGFVAVTYHAAQKIGRGAGHGREACRDGAARAALGRGEGLAPLGQAVVDQLLDGGCFESDDVFGDQRAERRELLFDLLRDALALDFVGREAEPHGTGIGQVGQLQIGRQGVLPGFDALGEHRFGES